MFQRRSRNIVWVRPDPGATKGPVLEPFAVAPGGTLVEEEPALAAHGARAALALHGLPSIPGVEPEVELRELLMAAAEIEHGLMAVYLYAAHSCTRLAVASSLRQISVEEMGHLLTVQNLLLAAGGKPYLGRYDQSPNEFDPFPFKLEPASRGVLAKYAACEMPDEADVDPEERDVLKDILAEAAASAGMVTPHRVGLLYMKLYWLLRESDEPLPDPAREPWPDYPVEEVGALFPGRHVAVYPLPGTLTTQGGEDDWGAGQPRVIVETISSRDEALQALARVTAQGEGFAGQTDAHFDRFVAAYRAATQPGEIARPFATNPWYAGGGRPGEPAAEIVAPLAVDFAKVGDYLYEILLYAIALALHPESGYGEEKRHVVAAFCIELMREVLKPFARALPLLETGNATAAKLSLCLTLPEGAAEAGEMHERVSRRLADALELARALEATPDINPQLRSAARTVRVFVETRGGEVAPA